MVEGLRALTEDGFAPRMMGPSAATSYLPVDSEFCALYLGGAASFDPVRALAALARQPVRGILLQDDLTLLQGEGFSGWGKAADLIGGPEA